MCRRHQTIGRGLSHNCNIPDIWLSQNRHILSPLYDNIITNMTKTQTTTKFALFAGAAALTALAPQAHAQSSDALIDKLVDKGILTANEAKDLREETDKDFNTAFQTKTGMPDWVTGYKFSGSFRGRYEQFSGDNTAAIDRSRLRYRALLGVTISMKDNLEAGFRIGSGDQKNSGQGNPVSQNSTMGNNWSDKGLYVDLAYGKWTPISGGNWTLSTTFGKMERDVFDFTWMVLDPDLTPEGGVVQGAYTINDKHTIAFTGGGFTLQDVGGSTHDPAMFGGQVLWKAKWTDKWSSTLGVAALAIANPEQLTAGNAFQINQGNTRYTSGTYLGAPMYNFTPIIGDASVTYTLDSFPLYPGAFPITLKGEAMNNPGAPRDNNGYWVGIILGKSGTKKTWELSYRYEYLEADAWYDQLADDDNCAYYKTAVSNAGAAGFAGGTNIKGHFLKLNYSFTDSLMFSASFYINDLINQRLSSTVEPTSAAFHFMADVMWKF